MAELAPYIFGVVLTLLAVFLVLLVLVQRGRGGGLTGALGGVGGSSAFGAKAGDVFTKITVVAASIWIAVCVAAAYWAGHRGDALGNTGPRIIPPPSPTAPDTSADSTEADGAAETAEDSLGTGGNAVEPGEGAATSAESEASVPAESTEADEPQSNE